MSKAFTREGTSEELLVVPRAPLPEGETNYVTPRGLDCLRAELDALVAARHRALGAGADEHPAEISLLGARVAALEARIATAYIVDVAKQPHDEVRFGATATVRAESGEEHRYQIVGVDEADASSGRVAFVAPVARALLGKRVGEVAVVRMPRASEELEVVAIDYGA